MRVFVTGATGVLGRRVVPLLVAEGHQVSAVARSGTRALQEAGATPVALDLFDTPSVVAAVEGHDAVVDLATRIPDSSRMALPWAWRENDRLRTDAAGNAAGAAIAAGARYVRESVWLVYADGGAEPIDEDAPLDPPRPARTALEAEAAADTVTRAGSVGVVLRFAQFYGPDSAHTQDLVTAARRGLGLFFGDPSGYDPRLHLDDAASAVVASLDAPPGIYNVADDEPLRRAEHVRVLADAVGRRVRTPPAFLGRLGPLRGIARSLRIDNRRFRGATGWTPQFPSAREGWPAVLAEMESAGR